MGTPRSPIWSVFGAVVLLLVAASSSSATTPTETSVVGSTECLDCAQKNIKSEDAAKGLRVVVKCKVSNEKYETKSVGAVDGNGNFNVKLPSDLLQTNGELKQECFTQLHNAPNAPCPDKNGLTSPSSKLILKSKGIFAAAGKLSFASATCVSATFLPPYSDPWHKKPYMDPWHKKHYSYHWHNKPKYSFHLPPKHDYHHHYPIYTPPTPTYKPTPHYNPPSGGYYNPPTPTYKPAPTYKPPPTYTPPSGGYYNPPTPTYKPAPTYKPPSGGYYNPPTPTYKPAPMYKPPSGGYYPGHPHTEANQKP
ncbi:proline-rich protein 4-like [Zingiber officinale]|uniref:Proline-rich protein n=1 Tax=Zingiber officinale TaxID=94328 RepID=A0A8J5LPF2_ZINOF|nr:proline-rich protein 4-like [Zingiber officinale]KAG6524445.1 hypothetical protein ZIOFF_014354 [Zingiber officinale]